MLHIVRGTTCAQTDAILGGMFAARKRVFVDLLKWQVPVIAERFEVDQFDDAHAVYLVVTGPASEHLASARLLPTTRPHILGDLYPELCDGPVPRGPATLEITRFCLDRSLTANSRRTVRDRLVSAIVDYARTHDIGCYTGVAELGWLQQILAFGWRCRSLGKPRTIHGAMLGALAIDINGDTPASLARNGIYAPHDQELLDAA